MKPSKRKRKRLKKTIVFSDIDGTAKASNLPFRGGPNPSVREYLKAQKKRGAQVIYLTSRPTALEKATKKWLRKHKFPNPRRVIAGASQPSGKIDVLKEFCGNKNDCILIENHDRTREGAADLGIKVIDPQDEKSLR